MKTNPPNIILILADQMRGDCLGAAGHPVVETPFLDYLASRGAFFRRAYSAVPSCLPARAILWTGQDQWHTGVLGMGPGGIPIPNDFPHTLPGEFRNAGYRVHLVGKGHFHPPRTSMGFETAELDEEARLPDCDYRRWFAREAPEGVTPDDHGVHFNSWHAHPWHTEERLHPTAWTLWRALEFLRRRDRSRPYFLNISFTRPHSPYAPPAWYFDRYYRRATPPPVVGDWASRHDDPFTALDPNAWRGQMRPEAIHRARSGYLGEISFLDTQIGRLLHFFEREDPESFRRTWIIFTSDHGDMQGDHHLWRKTYAYEGSARIPLLIVPPLRSEFPIADHRPDACVELRDLMPTILEAAGLPIPPTVEGLSLLPLLRGERAPFRPYVHGEHLACYAPEMEMHYLTDGRRKFIWYSRTGEEQFFDLEQDPGECHNRIEDPARQSEIALWRNRLTEILEQRTCGWVRNGRPFRVGTDPLRSPWADRRWPGPRVEEP